MAKTTEMVEVALSKLKPYERNAKKHPQEQVEKIKNSIIEFGFLSPCLIDKDNNIIAGHGRVMAAQELGIESVPCVYIEGLTEEQRRAYILADNKLTELGGWDMGLVDSELQELGDIDIDVTGFSVNVETADWFDDHDDGRATEEDTEEYKAFVDKFEAKHTTDDCYTPANIYDAIAEWVANEYKLDRSKFIRPFYPGGDYENETYPPGCVVVDNPPFSILAKICRFYMEHGIKFFLFAPTLTLFSANDLDICNIAAGCDITYENGAKVNTSFRTNLEPGVLIRTAPDLTEKVAIIDKENTQSDTVLLKYAYPPNVIISAKVANWSAFGVEFKIPRVEARHIRAIDAQKDKGLGMYGSGFLVSDPQAAKAAKAAKAAGIPVEDINEDGEIVWILSDRERQIVDELNRAGEEARHGER